MMSRKKELVKNTLILGIGTFLPKLASFVTLPILTAYLTKEEYGYYDLVTVLASLVLPAVTLQIQGAAFRFLIDVRDNYIETKKIITNIYLFLMPISVISITILFFIVPGNNLQKSLICAYYFSDILVSCAGQITRGLARNRDFSLSAIISAVGKMLFALLFVLYQRLGLTGAIASLLMGSVISFVVLIFRIKMWKYIDFSLFNIQVIKEMLGYSWPMVPNSLSMWVMNLSDRFVVTLFLGIGVNAVYSVANKIPSILTLAQSTFTMAWQENASIVSRDDDVSTYYSDMFHITYRFMAGALGLLICSTPILFKLLIRGDYQEAYVQMPVLFLSMFFYSQSSFLAGIYVAYKDTKSVGLTTMLAAFINLSIDLLLVNIIGLWAASFSTLISYVALFIFRAIDVRKYVKINYNLKMIVVILLVLFLQCILFWKNNNYINAFNAIFGFSTFVILNRKMTNVFYLKIKELINKE